MKYANNPLEVCALTLNQWIGTISKDGEVAIFDTLEHGIRAAAIILMRTYRKQRINTIREIIDQWAPAVDKPSMDFSAYVSKHANIPVRSVLRSRYVYAQVIYYMWAYIQQEKPSLSMLEILGIIQRNKIGLT